jgi:hypothetical protein
VTTAASGQVGCGHPTIKRMRTSVERRRRRPGALRRYAAASVRRHAGCRNVGCPRVAAAGLLRAAIESVAAIAVLGARKRYFGMHTCSAIRQTGGAVSVF